MSIRHQDWPERLAAFIEQRQTVPFTWGVNDCVTHAADAALTMTGDDPLGALRGAWRDEATAAAVLAGFGGLRAAVCVALGPPMPSPAMARRGDIVLVRFDRMGIDAELLAVCIGSRWVAPSDEGVRTGSMTHAVDAWPVGWGD